MLAMKLIILLSIFCIGCVTGIGQQPASRDVQPESGVWANAAPADAGFKILMPGKAEKTTRPVASLPGVENHVLLLQTDLAAYMVSYVQFPSDVTDPVAIKTLLDRGREGGLKSSKGELKSEKEVTLDGHAGREWVITLPYHQNGTARAYWVRNRLYQTLFIEQSGSAETPQLQRLRQDARIRFLDSFELSAGSK